MRETEVLTSLAVEASGAERNMFYRRAWAVLLSVIPLLLRRHEANALLPGTVRDEELDYEAHVQAAVKKAKDDPIPSPPELRVIASLTGYVTLLDAIYASLNLLRVQLWPAVQKKTVELFVLQGLDVIPRTAGTPADLIICDDSLVSMVERRMNPQNYEPAF